MKGDERTRQVQAKAQNISHQNDADRVLQTADNNEREKTDTSKRDECKKECNRNRATELSEESAQEKTACSYSILVLLESVRCIATTKNSHKSVATDKADDIYERHIRCAATH